MPDKIYTPKPVTIEAKRRLRSYTVTNNPDGSRVIDAIETLLNAEKDNAEKV